MTQLAGHSPFLKTRCKFYVSGVTLVPGTNAVKANLSAVARGDRNAEWAVATPSGSMELYINNPVAAEKWESFMRESRASGKQPEVFIDIYTSTDGWPGDGHKFREADIPEGVYGHGACGECGQRQDAKMYEWSEEAKRSVETDKLVHPNG